MIKHKTDTCYICNETQDTTTYNTRVIFLCSDKYCHKSICTDCWTEVKCADCDKNFCTPDHLRTCNGCNLDVCLDCIDLESGDFDDSSSPSECAMCRNSPGSNSNLRKNFVTEEEIAVQLRNMLEFEVEPLTSKVPEIMRLLDPILQFREKLRRAYLNKRVHNETRKQRIFNLCSKEWSSVLSEHDKQCSGEVETVQINDDGRVCEKLFEPLK